MSIDAIKQELAQMDDASRHQILAFLVAIVDRKYSDDKAAITRMIDDKNPANWLTLEEFDKRLSLREDEKSG
jgi:hypothetical protein